jgi:hypothetical protein
MKEYSKKIIAYFQRAVPIILGLPFAWMTIISGVVEM